MKKIALIFSALLVAFVVIASAQLEQDFLNEMDIPAAQSNTSLNNGNLIERVMVFSSAPKDMLTGSKQNTRILVIEDRFIAPGKNLQDLRYSKKEIYKIDFGQQVTITNSGNNLNFSALTVASKKEVFDASNKLISTTSNKVMNVPDISTNLVYANKGAVLNLKAAAIFQSLRRNLK